MATYRIDISYDGGGFKGWARQEGLRTVQAEAEAALAQLFEVPVSLTVAGRTDAGVHATGQVASFSTPEGAAEREPATLQRALQALTPPDIAIRAVSPAEPGFDARGDATARRYRYRIHTGPVPSPFERQYSLFWPHRMDRALIEQAAAMLAGTHDFTAFTPTETQHVRFERDVSEACWSDGGAAILHFEIEADAFMRSMVRALVGTLLEIGAERRSLENFAELLQGRPRPEAGETAPAHGLFLIAVRY